MHLAACCSSIGENGDTSRIVWYWRAVNWVPWGFRTVEWAETAGQFTAPSSETIEIVASSGNAQSCSPHTSTHFRLSSLRSPTAAPIPGGSPVAPRPICFLWPSLGLCATVSSSHDSWLYHVVHLVSAIGQPGSHILVRPRLCPENRSPSKLTRGS